MTVESATYISQLNSALPADSDEIPEGDNHIRLMKAVMLTSVGSLGAAALTVTAAQVNDVVNKALKAGDTYTGTHDFSGATAVNVPAPSSGSNACTKTYADALVIASTAPTWAPSVTAVSKTLVAFEFCRVTASGQTLTFPISPTAGVTRFGIEFDSGITGTFDPGSEKIKGSPGTMTCNSPGLTLTFLYLDSTAGWVIGA